MNFKPGDKVKRKRMNLVGVIVAADKQSWVTQGVFKVAVKWNNQPVTFVSKSDIELIAEPNDVLKNIL